MKELLLLVISSLTLLGMSHEKESKATSRNYLTPVIETWFIDSEKTVVTIMTVDHIIHITDDSISVRLNTYAYKGQCIFPKGHDYYQRVVDLFNNLIIYNSTRFIYNSTQSQEIDTNPTIATLWYSCLYAALHPLRKIISNEK